VSRFQISSFPPPNAQAHRFLKDRITTFHLGSAVGLVFSVSTIPPMKHPRKAPTVRPTWRSTLGRGRGIDLSPATPRWPEGPMRWAHRSHGLKEPKAVPGRFNRFPSVKVKNRRRPPNWWAGCPYVNPEKKTQPGPFPLGPLPSWLVKGTLANITWRNGIVDFCLEIYQFAQVVPSMAFARTSR